MTFKTKWRLVSVVAMLLACSSLQANAAKRQIKDSDSDDSESRASSRVHRLVLMPVPNADENLFTAGVDYEVRTLGTYNSDKIFTFLDTQTTTDHSFSRYYAQYDRGITDQISASIGASYWNWTHTATVQTKSNGVGSFPVVVGSGATVSGFQALDAGLNVHGNKEGLDRYLGLGIHYQPKAGGFNSAGFNPFFYEGWAFTPFVAIVKTWTSDSLGLHASYRYETRRKADLILPSQTVVVSNGSTGTIRLFYESGGSTFSPGLSAAYQTKSSTDVAGTTFEGSNWIEARAYTKIAIFTDTEIDPSFHYDFELKQKFSSGNVNKFTQWGIDVPIRYWF